MAYPMVKTPLDAPHTPLAGDCTDGTISEEIVIHRSAGIMGSLFVIRWHPKYGTVNVAHEFFDGTRLKLYETQIPELTKREFRKSAFRRSIDRILDRIGSFVDRTRNRISPFCKRILDKIIP